MSPCVQRRAKRHEIRPGTQRHIQLESDKYRRDGKEKRGQVLGGLVPVVQKVTGVSANVSTQISLGHVQQGRAWFVRAGTHTQTLIPLFCLNVGRRPKPVMCDRQVQDQAPAAIGIAQILSDLHVATAVACADRHRS